MQDPTSPSRADADVEIEIELKDRTFAAFLAWLLPGAGHAYQGRWGKSVLFFTCIMGTFVFGMYLGDCKVVYASWGKNPDERRLPYFLQLGVGLPAMPALVQAGFDSQPFGSFMAPPLFPGPNEKNVERTLPNGQIQQYKDELAYWNLAIEDFELGTVYTMIAGLLNVLAVYDAWAGPVMIIAGDPRKRKKDGEESASSKEKDVVQDSGGKPVATT